MVEWRMDEIFTGDESIKFYWSSIEKRDSSSSWKRPFQILEPTNFFPLTRPHSNPYSQERSYHRQYLL
jgi:hypothetical protein